MLVGFEEETKPLTASELKFARLIYARLQLADNKFVKGHELINWVFTKTGHKIAGTRLRKLIAWIHLNGHTPTLIATSKGYRIATKEEAIVELEKYGESLQGRIDSMEARKEVTLAQLNKLKGEQAGGGQPQQIDLFQ